MKDAHNPNDTDSSELAIHHTLGLNRHQAIPGDALKDIVLSNPVTLAEIRTCLIRLGAQDAPT